MPNFDTVNPKPLRLLYVQAGQNHAIPPVSSLTETKTEKRMQNNTVYGLLSSSLIFNQHRFSRDAIYTSGVEVL